MDSFGLFMCHIQLTYSAYLFRIINDMGTAFGQDVNFPVPV